MASHFSVHLRLKGQTSKVTVAVVPTFEVGIEAALYLHRFSNLAHFVTLEESFDDSPGKVETLLTLYLDKDSR